MSKSAISKWVELFSNECQKKVNADPTALNDADLMKENLRLRKELEEARKDNLFLKKIVRRRKPGYTKGHPYKLFRNRPSYIMLSSP